MNYTTFDILLAFSLSAFRVLVLFYPALAPIWLCCALPGALYLLYRVYSEHYPKKTMTPAPKPSDEPHKPPTAYKQPKNTFAPIHTPVLAKAFSDLQKPEGFHGFAIDPQTGQTVFNIKSADGTTRVPIDF